MTGVTLLPSWVYKHVDEFTLLAAAIVKKITIYMADPTGW